MSAAARATVPLEGGGARAPAGDLCAVLVNARAGGVARDRALLGALRTIVGADGLVEATDDLAQLPQAAERLLQGRPRFVALCGGDGTLAYGLGALEGAARARGEPLPPLLPLPAGTMATILRGIGARPGAAAVLADTMRDLREGLPLRTEARAYLHANGRPGFLVGAVIVARLIELYNETGAGGPAGAWKLVPPILSSALLGRRDAGTRALFEPEPVRLVADGMVLPLRAIRLLLAGTVADVGVGMRFLYRAGERPDRLHALAFDGTPPQLARRFHRAFLGRPFNLHDSFDGLAARFEAHFEREVPFILDGEILRTRTLVVEHAGTLSLVR